MKKMIALFLSVLMVLAMAACGQEKNQETTAPAETAAPAGTEAIVAPAEDVAMNYISVEDALAHVGEDGYTFFDVRKAEDYAAGHIPGAVGTDMDAAKEGDFAAGVATMQEATKDLDDTLILVCYSGKRYAQATTNVLSALGYDMSRVLTLEGGFKAWTASYPEEIEAN